MGHPRLAGANIIRTTLHGKFFFEISLGVFSFSCLYAFSFGVGRAYVKVSTCIPIPKSRRAGGYMILCAQPLNELFALCPPDPKSCSLLHRGHKEGTEFHRGFNRLCVYSFVGVLPSGMGGQV